jgi:hypothetical protein
MAKKSERESEREEDALAVITRALRNSTPELKTGAMEVVVGAMVDVGNWGSICWWHGELEHALMEYFQLWERNREPVCQHCFRNLGPGLQERLRGKIEIERAVR